MILTTRTLLLFLVLNCTAVFSQSPPPLGLFELNPSGVSNVKAFTPNALGVGTIAPQAKLEVEYCAGGHEYTGLQVTRKYCGGMTFLPRDLDFGGLLGEGAPSGSSPLLLPHYYTPVTAVGLSPIRLLNKGEGPLFWLKNQTDATSGNEDITRMIVTPSGHTGINVANPRGALDVITFGKNTPAAIFGVRSQRGSVTVKNLPGLQQYSQHIEVVPHCTQGAFNDITQNKDLGLFFTDGWGNEGQNREGALVIAPWSDNALAGVISGGLRMEANGNTELRGNFRCTRLTVNAKWWPDAVFADDYRLMPLSEVAGFIKANRHLPGIPSEKAVLENGQDVGALQVLQQQKIEELTLYAIEQEQKSAAQQQLILEQKKKLEEQEARLRKLESILTQK